MAGGHEMFNIQEYMTRGVERVIKDALRATLKNPKESAFMMKFATACRLAAAKRGRLEAAGEHIPPFLIASITSTCNLHCEGCYSRQSHATNDRDPVSQLSDEDWAAVFAEAEDLGISFILLAGGEPLLRRGVIEAAGRRPNILFPVFTNGVFMNERYFDLFDRCRNLIPIMSIEGDRELTDARRGPGIYDRLISNMEALYRRKLMFGVSVTVTTQNMQYVFSENFIRGLWRRGCKSVIYVEYVPVNEDSESLALDEEQREFLNREVLRMREAYTGMVFISFPGDEKSSGGCVAAGRGFFHINSHGGAEPCPFSPFSDVNVKEASIRGALKSRLFYMLNENGILEDDHKGGCVLYKRRHFVEAVLNWEDVDVLEKV